MGSLVWMRQHRLGFILASLVGRIYPSMVPRALFAGEKRLVQSCVPVVKTRDSPSLYLTDGSKIEVFW